MFIILLRCVKQAQGDWFKNCSTFLKVWIYENNVFYDWSIVVKKACLQFVTVPTLKLYKQTLLFIP